MNQIDLIQLYFDKVQSRDHTGYEAMLMDLYRAITCFRYYESFELFMRVNPEFVEAKKDIKDLWKEFETLTDSQLAEVGLEILQDLY